MSKAPFYVHDVIRGAESDALKAERKKTNLDRRLKNNSLINSPQADRQFIPDF
jgi:hypothetical protein